MFATSRIILLLVTSVFLSQWQSANSSGFNETQTSLDDEEEADAALENMNFAEFKERYRRLIPYMTYFVANNYVNSQVLGGVPKPQGHDREATLGMNPLIRKPQRLVPIGRPVADTRIKSNEQRTSNVGSLYKQPDKFVPSIQYDPKDIGSDTNYFTPLRYTGKFNHETIDYSDSRIANRYREYERPEKSKIYTKVTSSQSGILHQDSRNYERTSSTRPYNTFYDKKYLPPNSKIPFVDNHQDYVVDYGTRTSIHNAPHVNSDYNYPIDHYEPVRYFDVKSSMRNHQKSPTRILAQSLPIRPQVLQPSPTVYSIGNNPSASLDDIMKSLQLTNRLPEMLNKYNIDSSIITLVEILSILQNTKKTNISPRLPVENFNRHVPNYNNYKQTYTRPKVVTETRFQVTPSPSLIRDEQSIRYKPEVTYETNSRLNVPLNTNYEPMKNGKQENVIEYYRPLVHDIEEGKIDNTYKTNERPIKVEEESEHTYEIDTDSADDLLGQQEEYEEEEEKKYVLPITTEMPINKYKLKDGESRIPQLVPPTMPLKYGATRGKPNVDYPAYAVIPETEFNCKEQRYKGFFGDPSTDCQVWHYCDLNGGKSSFLCPNGTIFSQVALTCDWWFNVKCESTAQLYVLNERLYKYILPIMPKFPEDFSGPEVDRYLELKFKEMEEKLKEKKLKKQQEKDKVKEKLQGLESEE